MFTLSEIINSETKKAGVHCNFSQYPISKSVFHWIESLGSGQKCTYRGCHKHIPSVQPSGDKKKLPSTSD